jgi:S1-C subfamily serine protease
MEGLSKTHQTIIVVALAVSAVIGAVTGVLSSSLVSGALQSTQFLSPVLNEQLAPAEVDRKIADLVQEESATIAVVQRVTPAVVSVVIKVRRGDLISEADEFSELYFDPYYYPSEPLTQEEADELVEVGGGTGFFVSSDGYIVTNKHVVNDPTAVYSVVTNDGVELPAVIAAQDPFLDLAILDVEGDSYPTAVLGNSDDIQIGQTVIAIGNTLSEFRNTVTKGVISGINRRVIAGDETGEEVLERAIQTDAAINPGNSGGPLINLLGEVVAVNTAVSFEGQSLGFAIPINDIKKAVRDVQEFGRIVRPWLGVRYQMITDDLVAEFNLPVGDGALLIAGEGPKEPAVVADSPADAAGLLEGDAIVSVNGQDLTLDDPLGPVMAQYYPGDSVELEIIRGEEMFRTTVTLGEAQR